MPWAPRRAKPPHEPEYPNRQSAPPPSCTAADLYRQNLPLAPDGMHDRVGPLRLTRKSSAHRQKRYYREKSGLEPQGVTVTLLSGKKVSLRSGFSILRDKLAAYDAQSAAKITGVHANVIRRFAREFAQAKSAIIYCGAACPKILHGDLVQRAQILMAALTGNNGRPGGGWQEMTFFELDGKILSAFVENVCDLKPDDPAGIWAALIQMGREQHESPTYFSGSMMRLEHAGTRSERLNPAYNDPTLPRTPEQFLKEALARGDINNYPGPELSKPEIIFNMFGNPF